MTPADPPASPPPPLGARRTWRRPLYVAAAIGGLVVAGWLGVDVWSGWQERLARDALAEEDLDSARRHLGLAFWVRSGRVSTNLLAAQIARAARAYADAEPYLVRCKELGGMTEPLQMEWLLLRCEKGDVDSLAPGLLAAVDQNHPESAAILESLALVYMRQTRYPEALGVLNKWVERVPNSPRALDWHGWVCNQMDRRGEAIDDYSRALELRPGRSAVRLRLAQLLIESARQLEALPHLERLLAERPDDPDVLVGLASCDAVQLRTSEARKRLDAVLAVHPEHFGALRLRGKLEREEGNYAEAERWLRKALERKPLDPETRYTLYLVFLAQPDRQRDAADELARWEQGRQTIARVTILLRSELIARPKDPDLMAEAGELLFGQGEDQRGLFWLNRALSIDPNHKRSHKALAEYYDRTQNPTLAEAHRRYLAGAPEKR